ncbi:hypothetical protein [Actinoplanes sp. NPDC049802]
MFYKKALITPEKELRAANVGDYRRRQHAAPEMIRTRHDPHQT